MPRSRSLRISRRSALALVVAAVAAASPSAGAGEVVLYCSMDEPFARPVIEAFEQRSGTTVRVIYPDAAGDSGALGARIRAEKGAPRADVLWDGAALEAILLAGEGLLGAHTSGESSSRPLAARDPDGRWHAFAGRARVFVYNSKFPPEYTRGGVTGLPQAIRELWSPAFGGGRFIMARPDHNTCGAQFAAAYTLWGEGGVQTWCFQMRQNRIRIVEGESLVVESIANDEAQAGLTDADRARAAAATGQPVDMLAMRHDPIYPNMEGQQPAGAIIVPSVAGIIAGGPNPEEATALLDFLLSADAERLLASGAGGMIPLRPEVASEFPALLIEDAAQYDLREAASSLDAALEVFRRAFPN